MKKIRYILLMVASLYICSCSDYDTTRINEDLADIENTLSELEKKMEVFNNQLTGLNELAASSFISNISQDAEGNYVISYQTGKGDSKTIVIATQEDIVTQPIIGIAKDEADGNWYWRATADNGESYYWLETAGKRIPVGGIPPTITINSDGYWEINGELVTNKDGNALLANDVSNILFQKVEIDQETGRALFTLADGTVLDIQFYEVLGIRFEAAPVIAVPDRSKSIKIKYELLGTEQSSAIVDCFTAYNVSVKVEPDISTITVKLDDNAQSGNLIMMVHANGNTILKPLFFTYGTAEIDQPILDSNGVNGQVILEGEMTNFDIKVSADIDYEVTVSEDALEWILPVTTRAKIETTYSFTADYYENETGLARTGIITFANRFYDVSVQVVVKQTPVAPAGQGGISNAADLLAFANAVNAGAGTSRWQDETGAVILNNDIDMSEITTWTPIGKVESGHTTVNPFTGVFDGKGFAIKNLRANFTIGMESNLGYGLFGAIQNATIRNLKVGSEDSENQFSISGTAVSGITIGGIAGYSENSVIEACSNYVNIAFEAEDPAGILVSLGGITGTLNGGTLGGEKKVYATINYGNVYTGKIANEANGGTGMQVAGICGYMLKITPALLNYCINYGDVSAPTGRGGGLVATADLGVISNCENYGTVEDDKVGQYQGVPAELTYNVKRQGGLVGALTQDKVSLEYCTNHGDVYSHLSCRTGGFVGHNTGVIIGCVNKGTILADTYTEGNGVNKHGAGWACGYSKASSGEYINVKGCAKGGRVGDFSTYKGNPAGAPEATDNNAFSHKPETYDPSINN